MNPTALRAAGLVVYRIRDGKLEYLLLQTSYGGHHWSPPKGHVDAGEDERAAAIRETQEEAGLSAEDYHLDDHFHRTLHYVAHGHEKSVKYWPAKLVRSDCAEVKLSSEHQAFDWLDLDGAIARLKDYDDICEMMRQFDEYLNK